MKNGNAELCDVVPLLKQFRDSGGHKWPLLLQARAALTDACEGMMDTAAKESRGLTTDERRAFDDHIAQARDITADLAKIKAALVAMSGADMVHVPF